MRLTVVRLPLLALPLLLLLAACGSDDASPGQSGSPTTTTSSTSTTTTTAVPAETCSTSGLRVQLADQDLAAPVAATRKAVFDAALACDYDALAAIAGDDFSYTFGGEDPAGVAHHWRQEEAGGTPVLKVLVQVLNLPHVQRPLEGEQTYVSWPSADQEHRTDADWDALVGLYTEDEVAAFRTADLYYGWRTGIRDDGHWMYFIAGD